MTNVTCGLTAKKPGSAPCPTLVIEYGTTFYGRAHTSARPPVIQNFYHLGYKMTGLRVVCMHYIITEIQNGCQSGLGLLFGWQTNTRRWWYNLVVASKNKETEDVLWKRRCTLCTRFPPKQRDRKLSHKTRSWGRHIFCTGPRYNHPCTCSLFI